MPTWVAKMLIYTWTWPGILVLLCAFEWIIPKNTCYLPQNPLVVCYLRVLPNLLCKIILLHPLQRRYVHHCHSFQTDLLHMVLIWLLILMWVQLLLTPVMMVTVCPDLRLESVYSEGDGIACHLCASVRMSTLLYWVYNTSMFSYSCSDNSK